MAEGADALLLSDGAAPERGAVRVSFSRAPTPEALAGAYRAAGVQIVLECTGEFVTQQSLAPYLEACGAAKVRIRPAALGAECSEGYTRH